MANNNFGKTIDEMVGQNTNKVPTNNQPSAPKVPNQQPQVKQEAPFDIGGWLTKQYGGKYKQSSYDPDVWEGEDGSEWGIFNEERANKEARDSVYTDEGIAGFTPNFQDWIVNNAISPDFMNKVIDEEIDYYGGEGDKEQVKRLEAMRDDPNAFYDYVKKIYGPSDLARWLEKNSAIDWDKVKDEAISWDGRGHFISSYDGNEVELPNGLYGYRRN